ncbi:MAG TPA: sialate O-acetylesterase [Luteimonas sp.]|nr:sialate O-acetylesterase [Luteimonas sp.]
MRRWTLRLFTAGLVLLPVMGAHALELPRIFSDGMVLQRDQPIRVWGRSEAGARIVLEFAGTASEARVDANGDWHIELPALAAGGPHAMRIDDGAQSKELRDVYVGDVWLASGQSNMEWPIRASNDADAEAARAIDPLIRHYKVPRSWSGEPQWQLAGGEWIASSPAVAGDFSAVAHFFARELREATGVPIGIIDSTWGGSRIEAWMDAGTLGLERGDIERDARERAEADERNLSELRRRLARFGDASANGVGWEAPELDDAAWLAIRVPGLWEDAGWDGMDGEAWYRTTFTLDDAEAKAGVLLGVGRIDDSDSTWVNGVQVGETRMQYDEPRRYMVPGSALRAGANAIAVRVTDTGGGGGIHGPPGELFVQPVDGAPRMLAGEWKFRPAQVTVSLVDGKNQSPALLYNAMIHPLQPFPLRGVIWYQGESNADTVDEAVRYRTQFPAMIGQWRRQWNAPELPFQWVQLASFGSGRDAGAQSPWAVLRESQSATLSLPATAQVVAIDIGDVADIHPRNKQDVGRRLALAARHVAYGEALVHAGPRFTGMRTGRGAVTLSFDAGDSALAVRGGGALRGFDLAGADRLFHPAEAAIEGDRIVVRSRAVPSPVAVRYAWKDAPVEANLGNAAGLPAPPFRSDDW